MPDNDEPEMIQRYDLGYYPDCNLIVYLPTGDEFDLDDPKHTTLLRYLQSGDWASASYMLRGICTD